MVEAFRHAVKALREKAEKFLANYRVYQGVECLRCGAVLTASSEERLQTMIAEHETRHHRDQM